MPFWLTNTRAVHQTLLNNLLQDILNQFVFVYLNDSLTFSRNNKGHVTDVRSVLCCLLDNNLLIKGEKCEFYVASVSFLGYIIAT